MWQKPFFSGLWPAADFFAAQRSAAYRPGGMGLPFAIETWMADWSSLVSVAFMNGH